MQLLDLNVTLNLAAKLLALKGNLVYEYNPFKTLRINKTSDSELGDNPPGSLLDLDTESLTFDLNHPVDLAILPSYDGSVNVILNDNKNAPRLINSRFSVTGMNTYLIVDREGDNDTNIYDKESFDTDISLYKKSTTIAKLKFLGISNGGNLKVGNYHFYFKLADSDGNETDFIAESGVVCCHIGNLNDPFSILGGIRDLNSYKAVHFLLSNLDPAYNQVVVYYTRSTADNLSNATTTAHKIFKYYPIYNTICELRINGYEEVLDVSINDINTQYNLVECARTLDIALNMLFMGNVNKSEIPYKELADLSLRFYPKIDLTANIGFVDLNYIDSSGKYEYYNVENIYNKLGYWDDEIYRFGIVYIMKDYTLSPVFNIRGSIDSYSFSWGNTDNVYNNGYRQYIPIDKDKFLINLSDNSKGVVKLKAIKPLIINSNGVKGVFPIGIKFYAHDLENLLAALQQYTVGYFFVRLKRIATTLCLAVTMGVEVVSHLPTLPIKDNKYIMESFITKDRLLSHSFRDRCAEISDLTVNPSTAAICPEYELNAPFFNLLFVGTEFYVKPTLHKIHESYYNLSNNYFYNMNFEKETTRDLELFRIVSLQDSLALAKNKNSVYSAMAGTAEEGFRVSYYRYNNSSVTADNLLRGAYGPYLGLEGHIQLPKEVSIIDIKIPSYNDNNSNEYFQVRYLDSSSFSPITDRLEWKDYNKNSVVYRGDCFIGNFTHRMVRNFADPTAPYNDQIIDTNNWADNMELNNPDTYEKINRGDVNAVKMGHWVTVKVCSNLNLSMRSVDHSWAAEELITNRPRAFYPLYSMDTSGETKIPESNVYNDGYTTTISSKYNYELPNVPAIKNVFSTRIMYSNIAINDAFRNGFRIFNLVNYKDYAFTYGALTRIVELNSNLLAVFEHGVCLIPVNERAIAGRGAGGNVFINTSNVLPDNPKVLSDMYGSLWSESVIKTANFIYGIDTVGKKIWRTNGERFDIISDMLVLKFLIDNISLTETETKPIIGLRNVKSHYNAYKGDIMFTFYDDINTIEEKVWNLCFNEVLNKFSTFYSWVPSYSANIDNIMFSFDRDTSKIITKLTSLYPLIYLQPATSQTLKTIEEVSYRLLGAIKIHDETNKYVISLYDDNSNNQDRYKVLYESGDYYWYVIESAYNSIDYYTVAVKAEMAGVSNSVDQEKTTLYVGGTIYGTVSAVKNGSNYKNSLTTAFWKHGNAGLMKHSDIKPCFWYGKLHPFEFEFVVLDNPLTHKIFNNLEIISNKALPESFHFDIVGEVYDWAEDKLNMYCRLEATKQLYQRLGSNIKFNPNYKKLTPKQRKILGSVYNLKSTYLPLYYRRIEYLDKIYNAYTKMQQPGGNWNTKYPRDYSHLSGSEIIYDPQLNEFRIWTHIACCPINGYYDKEITLSDYNYIVTHFPPQHKKAYAWQEDDGSTKYYERIFYGRIKGNSEYKEDKWYVLIPSIIFMLKNEANWTKPPLIISRPELPEDIKSTQVTLYTLPTGYGFNDIQILPNTGDNGNASPSVYGNWTARKETKIRDKYVRIRIRYTGNDLAVISAIKTIYTESYA